MFVCHRLSGTGFLGLVEPLTPFSSPKRPPHSGGAKMEPVHREESSLVIATEVNHPAWRPWDEDSLKYFTVADQAPLEPPSEMHPGAQPRTPPCYIPCIPASLARARLAAAHNLPHQKGLSAQRMSTQLNMACVGGIPRSRSHLAGSIMIWRGIVRERAFRLVMH